MATLKFVNPWPDRRIPYGIDQNVPHDFEKDIRDAMADVEAKTFLWFDEHPATKDPAYVIFKRADGSVVKNPNWKHRTSDVLGYCAGETTVNLGQAFLALHEIGHVIGLIHEHQRPDRDWFVTVHPDCQHLADCELLSEAITYGIPYNGRSPMHYGLSWGCHMEWVFYDNPGQQWAALQATDAECINQLYHQDYLPKESALPAEIDVGYCQLGLKNTVSFYESHAGTVIVGCMRFANKWGYAAAMPTFEAWARKNGLVLFGKAQVQWTDVNYRDLGLDKPTDQYDNLAGVAIRAAHRWSVAHGFVSGYPTFESWHDNCGVISLRQGTTDLVDVTYKDLGLEKPTNWYEKEAGVAIRAARRWAVNHGYVTGFPNFEASGDNCGVVCVKMPQKPAVVLESADSEKMTIATR